MGVATKIEVSGWVRGLELEELTKYGLALCTDVYDVRIDEERRT